VVWTVSFYSRRVEDDLLELPAGLVARFLRYAERMEMFGPDLGMPHTRAMGGGLFEIRLRAAEGEEDRQDASRGNPDRATQNEGRQR
jgi:phage-related protein